jgi:hypothetical protein
MPAPPAWLVAVLLLAALVLFVLAIPAAPRVRRINCVAAGLACWMLTLAWAAFARL